jgi:ABC-type proline/glycine betaine transport system ATPase subunit
MSIQDEAYSEAMDEIERWKVQHEEMLLKHAREQHIALSTLDEAMKEIERLKVLLKDRMYELEEINELKALLTRAADALEEEFGPGNTDLMAKDPWALIAELRKAAR